jgi:Fe2+ transport system protein FeoA
VDYTTEDSNLALVKNGETATIRKINTNDAVVRNRLFSMGLVEGRQVSVTKRSPFGGTICIELLGSALALRLSEAEAVSILV